MKSINHSKGDTTSWTENVGVLWLALAGTPCQVCLAYLIPGRALASSQLSAYWNELFFPQGSNIGVWTCLQVKNRTKKLHILSLSRNRLQMMGNSKCQWPNSMIDSLSIKQRSEGRSEGWKGSPTISGNPACSSLLHHLVGTRRWGSHSITGHPL